MAGILKFWYGINEKSEFMAGTCMGLEILSLKPTYFFLYLTQKTQYFFSKYMLITNDVGKQLKVFKRKFQFVLLFKCQNGFIIDQSILDLERSQHIV